jgi:hypothetical protein
MYTGKVYEGVFGGCFSTSPDFLWKPVLENVTNIPAAISAADFAQITSNVAGYAIPGFDNGFESAIVRIQGMNQDQSFTIKSWACVEYQPQVNSSIYEYSNPSPPLDPTAIALYREIALSIPVGVPVHMNSGMWQRVLQIIKTLTMAGSYLPGPYGALSSGVNLATNALSQLTM